MSGSSPPAPGSLPGTGRTAVVTGASSGIGAATARRLAAEGFDVVVGARRLDRLEELAAAIGGRALPLDLTDPESVAAFTAALDRVDVLVNNAGGAFDTNPVAEADLDSWARTYEVNVLGTVRLTKALLPKLRDSGAGDVLFVGSTAGLISYEGGASYTAAKHGVHTLAETLRLELCGDPVRVIEIAPGMVRTEEFSLNRTGSQERADAVYRGVREPLVAQDVADCIAWALTRPHHVNVDLLVVRPRAQAAQHKVARE
ncbi:SDR family oxidoreductase [Blastococcus sp. MG754426]|uniref:SDR family oxidoreductase n=1 Tax=unclassified Blastococcus TaxID=2619396 RepID=UPI001EF0DB6F|nr:MULTISPECIES: SDR family oxidoreductase [unclassified Blastococcus]MCF6508541.1 SDR family oxidoreductase [Blastococcus sp. MG754426]MCF6513080.1 SDR family oxidoreductase [Blastococcus sp. MG754427]MCF6737324.1 SDR family oxidoreductase [Blastococcus sp. KM273129]